MDHEQTLLTITAMRRQEETEYFTCDYFHRVEEDDDSEQSTNISSSSRGGCSSVPCDATCRQIMFVWMVKVVDFFPTMHRETVAYAMSYLDRFLQTSAGKTARTVRSTFQLAAIACLYTAVKLHEHAAVSPKFLEQLSRDEYTEDDLKQMELTILQALKWRLTTPTALGFLRQYMDIIPPVLLGGTEQDGDNHVCQQVFEMAKFQTEVALGDYKYVTVNASTIAYCALWNALEACLPKMSDRHSILWFVSQAAQLGQHSRYARDIQRSLQADQLVSCGGGANAKGGSSSVRFSMGYEVTASSHNKSGCSSPTGHHSPRTVCK